MLRGNGYGYGYGRVRSWNADVRDHDQAWSNDRESGSSYGRDALGPVSRARHGPPQIQKGSRPGKAMQLDFGMQIRASKTVSRPIGSGTFVATIVLQQF